jgi:hypothetical protein
MEPCPHCHSYSCAYPLADCPVLMRLQSKDPRWKQANPHDQLTAILSSMEGHLSNLEDGGCYSTTFQRRLHDHINQLKKLQPFLTGEVKW